MTEDSSTGVRDFSNLEDLLREFGAAEKSLARSLASKQAQTDSLTNSFRGVSKKGNTASRTLTKMKTALEQLGKFAQLTQGATKFASSIDRVAKMAGVSAEALQEFRFAATQSGVDIGTFDKALIGFGERLRGAKKGSGEFKKVLNDLGVSFQDTERGARATEEVLLDYAEAIRKVQDPAKRKDLAIAGFGTEGAVLDDFLALDREGMATLRKEARDTGAALNEQLIKQAKEANAQFSKLEQILNGNLQRALIRLAPEIGKVADELSAAGPGLKALTEFGLPERLRSSGSQRRRIEEQLAEKRAELERLRAASRRGRNSKADAARANNIPALEAEIQQLEKKLDLLSRIRPLETGADGGTFGGGSSDDVLFGGAGADTLGDSLLRVDEQLQATTLSFAGLTEAAGRFGAQGGTLTELLDATNGGFDRQVGLLDLLQKQMPELGEAMTGFFGDLTEGVGELDRAVEAWASVSSMPSRARSCAASPSATR